MLKGESSPIKLTLSGYDIGGSAEKPTLRIAKVAASREWLEVVLREFVEGKAIDLPPKAAPLLKILLWRPPGAMGRCRSPATIGKPCAGCSAG